jgi:hypothetical protein
MLANATLSFSRVASKENGDRVKPPPAKATDPIIGMVRAGVTEDLPPRRHALPELLWKCRERDLIHSKCAQSVPGERHGHPSLFQIDGISNRLGRRYLLLHGLEPSAPLSGLLKRKKFISTRQRWHAREQDVLDIIELEHSAVS